MYVCVCVCVCAGVELILLRNSQETVGQVEEVYLSVCVCERERGIDKKERYTLRERDEEKKIGRDDV